MNLKRALMILSGAFEFEKSHNSEVVSRPSDNEELPPLVREFQGDIGLKNKQRPFCYPYSIKARALLYAHLARYDLPAETLLKDQLYIVKKCPQLIQEMVNTASQLVAWQKFQRVPKEPRLESVENLMKLSPMVIQSCWEKSPLLQLPHFNDETLRMCTSKRRNIKTLGHFMRLKDSDRRHILRSLHEKQYQNVLNVCSAFPQLDCEVKLEVLDDDDKTTITAGAVVTANVMIYRNSYEISVDDMLDPESVPAIEEVGEAKEEDKDKTDSPAANKIKSKAWEKPKKMSKAKKAKNKKQSEQAKKKAAIKAIKEKADGDNKNHVDGNNKALEEVGEQRVKGEGSGDSGSESEDEQEEGQGRQNNSSDDESNNSDSNVDEVNEEDEWERLQSGITRKEKVLEGKSKESHDVHCPHYPDAKQEWWWVYLADRKSHKLVTLPQMVYDLKEEKEIQLQFTAPSKGNYQFQLCVRSDSYVDMDLIKSVKFDVKEAKKMEDVDKQWNLSDDEEDKNEEEDSDVDYTTDDEGSDYE